MASRSASHAGSWYSGNATSLSAELETFLEAVQPVNNQDDLFTDPDLVKPWTPPVKGCKAIIAPHAGYAYSGPAAAWAYKSIDTTGIKRVFILGPSHHVRLDGCALSKCTQYETPIGSLPLDLETIAQLRATGKFMAMGLEVDEDEHSIEMQLPYVRKIFEGIDINIVPIMVGGISQESEATYGRLLAPFLAREDTLAVISSDFCHWGTRFGYTYYYPTPHPLPPGTTPISLNPSSRSSRPSADFPIHASITQLDLEAMRLLELPISSWPGSSKTARGTHHEFKAYLNRTGNTICGRHPIGVLLGVLSALEEGIQGENGDIPPQTATLQWVRYEQSSQCVTLKDSSVSYASAYVQF